MAKSSKIDADCRASLAMTRTYPVGYTHEVILIGCGGTGSILAEQLCRLIVGFNLQTNLTLIDGDSVEDANITRQNFEAYEIGQNKATALALRLSGRFGLSVGAFPAFITRSFGYLTQNQLVVTCTDNLASRRIVAKCKPQMWLDAGNELDFGQAVFGTTHDPKMLAKSRRQFNKDPYCTWLPDICALDPKILTSREKKKGTGCAETAFAKQGFCVNMAAALAAAKIAKEILVDRIVKTHAVYFNVSDGRMLSRLITRDLFEQWKNQGQKLDIRNKK